MILKHFIPILTSLIVIFQSSIFADWSPPVTISPPASSLNIVNPVAIDTNSNAIVGWVDGPPRQSIFSAFLPSGSPTWNSPLLIFTTPLPPPNILTAPGMNTDRFGNQYAGFAFFPLPPTNSTVAQSKKSLAATSWPPPATANLGGLGFDSSASIDAFGNSQSIFSVSTTFPLLNVVFLASTSPTQVTLAQENNPPGVVTNSAVNARGILAWRADVPFLAFQASRYDPAANLLTPTNDIPLPAGTTNIINALIKLDQSGDAVIIFIANIGGTFELFSSTLLAGNNTWSNPLLISNPANNANQISLAVDAAGNANLLWTEQPSPTQEFVRVAFLPLNGTPTGQTNLTSPTAPSTFINFPKIVSDSFGNAIAIWGLFGTPGLSLIQVADKPIGQGWSAITTLSNNGQFPGVALSDQETAVAVWLDTVTDFVTGSTNRFPFTLQPPSQFVGRLKKNEFLTQSTFKLRITWVPSPAPNIVSYLIFDKKKLVATIPGSGPFTFTTHLASESSAKSFTIVAVASNGNRSLPVPLVVKGGD